MKLVTIPITKAQEPHCKVELANGVILNIRTIIMAAYQQMTDDGKPIINQEGKPVFALNSQTLVALEKEPPELKEMN